MLTHLTASMRFEGSLNVDLNEVTMNLVPFPNVSASLATLELLLLLLLPLNSFLTRALALSPPPSTHFLSLSLPCLSLPPPLVRTLGLACAWPRSSSRTVCVLYVLLDVLLLSRHLSWMSCCSRVPQQQDIHARKR